jgi:dipeptidase E
MSQPGLRKRLLLISSSTIYGHGYLDHVEAEVRDFLGNARHLVFLPYALCDRQAYAMRVRERFQAMGCTLTSLHEVSNPRRAIEQAEAIFVGGGNTFRLLKSLYDCALLPAIRLAVEAGMPYIGSSAGSIVAGPSLKTTKDMPIVQPPSFDALGLVDFQISPHYLDPDPHSRHMGETQEERILQFLEENDAPVAGLREGCVLRLENGSVTLKGSAGARIFRRGCPPVETTPVAALDEFLTTANFPSEQCA